MILHSEVINKPEWRHIYTLQEGEQWSMFGTKLIIIGLHSPPKIIHEDGTVETVEIYAD